MERGNNMRFFSLFMICGSVFCLYLLFDLLNTIDQMWFLQQLMIGMLSFVFIMSTLLFILVLLNQEINK